MFCYKPTMQSKLKTTLGVLMDLKFVIMRVHNSEHNSPINFDHDDDIHDSVTRIRKNKIGFIDGSCKRSNTDEVLGKQCFKIIGYPTDFGKKKSGQNFKKQNVSNNNSVAKSSSSGFSDEQMATLLCLIKDNKIRKNVQANMAGANQHMTYTAKGLDNVVDISHLKIKVGHPNRTEAFISKIGNLKLSNGLTLYVMDLNLKNILGTRDQCEGHTTIMNKSVSSSSSEFGGISVTADFPINFGNDADSSNNNFATQNEEVTTLGENVFSE
ncbi:hypothetical protein Tco_0356127, partial [Tanacetum coccineum]